MLIAVVGVGMSAYLISTVSIAGLIVVIVAALAFGVTMVLPIGGADMPVVISLLNAFTGTAVAMAGFVIKNDALIIAGALVGASGGILTKLMADAMNRSLANIIVGGFGTGDSAAIEVAGAGARGALHRQRRRGHPARLRVQGHHRARLRPGRGAGPARGGRAGRRCWRSAVWTSATPSTRWPAGCPGT